MPYITIIKRPHQCDLPDVDREHDAGTIWQCEVCCIQYRLARPFSRDPYWFYIGVGDPK
jgi:hypothetical protein